MKESRAEEAGRALADTIIEMAELFYQENTKKNFYKGLLKRLLAKTKEMRDGRDKR